MPSSQMLRSADHRTESQKRDTTLTDNPTKDANQDRID